MNSPEDVAYYLKNVEMVVAYAQKHGKIPALAEFGFKKGLGGRLLDSFGR